MNRPRFFSISFHYVTENWRYHCGIIICCCVFFSDRTNKVRRRTFSYLLVVQELFLAYLKYLKVSFYAIYFVGYFVTERKVDGIEDNSHSISLTGFKSPGADIKGQETKPEPIQMPISFSKVSFCKKLEILCF